MHFQVTIPRIHLTGKETRALLEEIDNDRRFRVPEIARRAL
jgi:hypothetical protein